MLPGPSGYVERVIAQRPAPYSRDAVTWAVFAALLAFGMLNAGLGAAMPYLRAVEHTSYLGGVLHQVAFAIGGGLAGLLAARAAWAARGPGRTTIIRAGMAGAGLAWLGVGYGNRLAVTVAAAFLVSFLGTSALIRMWAVLADEHGPRRTVALTEGEVSVSLGSIVAPALLSVLAATALGWRSAFAVGAAVSVVAVLVGIPVRLPAPVGAPDDGSLADARVRRLPPTLLLVVTIVALEFALGFWLASYLADDVGVGRRLAVAMVSGLYAAQLVGRLVASRLARRASTGWVLALAIGVALAGLPVLLAATSAVTAAIGLGVASLGIGAMFPLASSLHVGASRRDADGALGQVLVAAAVGQVAGPLAVAGIAQAADLRVGLLVLPALTLLAAAALRAS